MTSSKFTTSPRRQRPPGVCKKKKKLAAAPCDDLPIHTRWWVEYNGLGQFGFPAVTAGDLMAEYATGTDSWVGSGNFQYTNILGTFTLTIEIDWRWRPFGTCTAILTYRCIITPLTIRGFTQTNLYQGPHWFYYDSGIEVFPGTADQMRAIGHLP